MLRLRDFIGSSASLMLSQLLTAFVGFVFWFLAARSFTQSEVGVAAAVISGISLVGAIGVMGLGTLLIREIPRHPNREMGMIAASLMASTTIGGILGLGFVLLAPALSPDLAAVRETMLVVAMVAVGAGLTSASLVLDQAVIGLLRSRLQLARNVIAALLRLLLLVALAALVSGGGTLPILGAWVGSLGLSILAMGGYAAVRRSLPRVYPLHWDFLGAQRTSALKHHVLNLAIQLPGWAMPLVAVTVLSARTNGGFYFVWLLVGLASFIGTALTWMVYAAASRDPDSIAYWGGISLSLAAGAALVSAIGLWVLGPFVLRIFGAGYAEVAGGALVALPLTLFPLAIKAHYITINRVRGTVLAASVLVSLGAVLELVGAYVGASLGGLLGLGFGVLAATLLEAIPMLPTVFATIIRPNLPRQSIVGG
jgi:O-antigen/teichoic acid export membrane protein